MTLIELELRDFRNYEQLKLPFSKTVNVFYGNNAQGKSNLLEAIKLLTITRSFRTNNDRDLIRHGCIAFEVSGSFVDEASIRHQVRTYYSTQNGKAIYLNKKRIKSSSLFIGKFPIVHFSPESHRITSGAPAERRRFIDVLLCQSSASYLADLQDYNRVLRQRNALLARENDKSLKSWDHTLATYGCRIITARYQFVQSYLETLQQAYSLISTSSSPFRLIYRSALSETEVTTDRFKELLAAGRAKELRRKQTLIGPHRDDLILEIAGKDVRRFGSRGEHKSSLMALKIAEAQYLKERIGTSPIIVLDDLTSELDAGRAKNTLRHFMEYGQVFVSSVYPLTGTMATAGTSVEIVAGQARAVN